LKNKLKDKLNLKELFKGKINLKEKMKFNGKTKISPSILAIIILFLLLICAYVLFFEINDYRKIREEKYDFYYYFISTKINFEATASINGQDRIMGLSSHQVAFNSTPVYYEDYVGEVILPATMEIVFPYKSMPMYKLGAYSKIFYKNNSLYVNSEAGYGAIYNCFLYDGEDLYFFIEETTVKIGEELYTLSPLSFIEVDDNYIRMYNMQKDEYKFIEDFEKDVTAYTSNYMIELSRDSFSISNSYYLLIKNVDFLNLYEFK